jgi:hypothetical protein
MKLFCSSLAAMLLTMVCGWVGGWVGGQRDGWMVGLRNGWMGGQRVGKGGMRILLSCEVKKKKNYAVFYFAGKRVLYIYL